MRESRWLPYVSLFTSAGTLICCALPALFVALGMGAAVAGAVSAVPQLIWFSEHKGSVFGVGAIALAIAGYGQYHARNLPCPLDPTAARACENARRTSRVVYAVSLILFTIGAGFAFVPKLFAS